MTNTTVTPIEIQAFSLWDKLKGRRIPLSFDLEVTARCNNDCRHCYVNLPPGDGAAQDRELSLDEIRRIAAEAVELGAIWCLITGGEPLLRPDFPELYMALKRAGLLVSVFTNACLVTDEHVALFRRYPPRDIEVSVYGATKETYEAVTRRPGSFAAFRAGLDRLTNSGVRVRLKAMALRANLREFGAIADFCRAYTKDYYRFDPVLHLRTDRDPRRNAEIRAERLSPAEIIALEQADPDRTASLQASCDTLIFEERLSYADCKQCPNRPECDQYAAFSRLLGCGAGNGSFYVAYDGTFRLCASLAHPDCVYDLRQGTLREAWQEHVPHVRSMRVQNETLLATCKSCPLVNLCLWCPAHAYLETGHMEGATPYFCAVANARAANLGSPQRAPSTDPSVPQT